LSTVRMATQFRYLPGRAVARATRSASELGVRHDIPWLVYNPLQMRSYHQFASNDAPGVMQAVVDVSPNVRTLIDVGAGSGAFAAQAARRGLTVLACERSLWGRMYARRQGVRCLPFDLEDRPPAACRGDFDLACCFEVAEHVPPALGDRLVEFLATLAKATVFTAARPGQGGLDHVNEQPPEYWITRFEQHGAQYRPDITSQLREKIRANRVPSPWFQENLMVFDCRPWPIVAGRSR
jgi:SAM-dependent methyltransferase